MKLAAALLGIEKVRTKMKSIDKAMAEAAKESLILGAYKIQENAIKSIVQQSPGTPVTRYNPTRERVAAAPGQPPNSDTGNLVKNIGVSFDSKFTQAAIGTNLLYGKYLELGTEDMAARPWLVPAGKASEKFIAETFTKKVEEALERIKK